jgi:hypothetical protein
MFQLESSRKGENIVPVPVRRGNARSCSGLSWLLETSSPTSLPSLSYCQERAGAGGRPRRHELRRRGSENHLTLIPQ